MNRRVFIPSPYSVAVEVVEIPSPDRLREALGEIIGEASMCWSETPSGVFDDERAVDLIDRVMALVEK